MVPPPGLPFLYFPLPLSSTSYPFLVSIVLTFFHRRSYQFRRLTLSILSLVGSVFALNGQMVLVVGGISLFVLKGVGPMRPLVSQPSSLAMPAYLSFLVFLEESASVHRRFGVGGC